LDYNINTSMNRDSVRFNLLARIIENRCTQNFQHYTLYHIVGTQLLRCDNNATRP
jgi:hypothetical protein